MDVGQDAEVQTKSADNDAPPDKPVRWETSPAEDECWTALHLAAQHNDTGRVLRVLTEDPTAANAEDKCDAGIRPLLLAAASGFTQVAEMLIDAGASLESAHAANGLTPLIAAAGGLHVDLVQLLIRRGAELDRPEFRNWTALSFAAQSGHPDIVSALVAAGADLSWRTLTGLTPWMIAKGAEQPDICQLLVDAGAPHAPDARIWLSGGIPLRPLGTRIVDMKAAGSPAQEEQVQRFSDSLMGAYEYSGFDGGMNDTEYRLFRLRKLGQAVSLKTGDVGGGPSPEYRRSLGKGENAIIHFTSNPSAQWWQLSLQSLGAYLSKSSMGLQKNPLLRGKLSPKKGDSNLLEAVKATRWSIMVPKDADWDGKMNTKNQRRRIETTWVKVPRLKISRPPDDYNDDGIDTAGLQAESTAETKDGATESSVGKEEL